MEIRKIDNFTAEIIETPVVEPTIETYTIDQLKDEEATILKGINDYFTNHKGRLDKVRSLITQLQDLGLQSRVEIQAAQIVVDQAKVDAISLE